MILIGDTIVSFDILEQKFCCNLTLCKGICCVKGDAGAPVTEDESEEIQTNFDIISEYMNPAGIDAVREQGFSLRDSDGDLCTPLVDGKECAYTVFENGCALCAIEKAWIDHRIVFRKPISCHLYPIRTSRVGSRDGLFYHEWDVCRCAAGKGEPLYKAMKEALVRKYGEAWYDELRTAAEEIERIGGVKALKVTD